jgi:hypothetical protein
LTWLHPSRFKLKVWQPPPNIGRGFPIRNELSATRLGGLPVRNNYRSTRPNSITAISRVRRLGGIRTLECRGFETHPIPEAQKLKPYTVLTNLLCLFHTGSRLRHRSHYALERQEREHKCETEAFTRVVLSFRPSKFSLQGSSYFSPVRGYLE